MKRDKLKSFSMLSQIPGILYILIGLIIIFSVFTNTFISLSNLFNIIRQGSVLIIVSIGMLLAIISGGIDLSVGALLGLTGAIIAYLLQIGINLPLSIILAIAVCSICGLISGLIITKGGIFPFIVTFGMMSIVQGIGLGVTSGGSIHITNESFAYLGSGLFWGVPLALWITIFVVVIVTALLKKTFFSANIYAIGVSEVSARSLGIKVDLQKILVYVISATLAGIAGVVLASRIVTGNAIIGIGAEFEAIAAVVIGGTPISGGRGTLAGTVLGALVITVLKNGLTLCGFPPEATSVITGSVIMISVIIAQVIYQYQRRRSGKV